MLLNRYTLRAYRSDRFISWQAAESCGASTVISWVTLGEALPASPEKVYGWFEKAIQVAQATAVALSKSGTLSFYVTLEGSSEPLVYLYQNDVFVRENE